MTRDGKQRAKVPVLALDPDEATACFGLDLQEGLPVVFDVVITPSLAEAETWRKRTARDRRGGLFGQAVTTFDAWIADLWELHGDGRALVGGVQRAVLMRAVAQGSEDAERLAPVACACVVEAAGLHEFEQAVELAGAGAEVPGLSGRERAFAAMIARYYGALRERGLVEPGQAAAALARDGGRVFPRKLRVAATGPAPLAPAQERFFAACGNLELERRPGGGDAVMGRAPEGLQLRFAFPSGRLAEPGLIADCIAAMDAGPVVIACNDPLWMFDCLKDRLVEGGACLRVRAAKPFMQTDFGRAYLALRRCLNDDPWDPAMLADVLSSPFSGLSRADAVKADTRMRADRLLDREAALTEHRASSGMFSQLEQLARGVDVDAAVDALEGFVHGSAHRGEAWRAEQLAALKALRRVAAAVRAAGAGAGVCASVLEGMSLPVSAQVGGGGRVVLVTTQALASQLEPGSFSTLVAADLTSERYPVADKDDAGSTFLGAIGIEAGESALARARRQFRSLLLLPSQAALLVRPLGDENADATYPSVVLEEFVDAYRDDPAATDDIDNPYRLPETLRGGIVERGEELLFANSVAAPAGAGQGVAAEVPEPFIDDLRPGDAALVMPERRTGAGAVLAKPSPSPSQIELYLECPYQWFASRRMGLEELDEGFGPLERGTFAHAVLERFYREFQASGNQKVNAANIAGARSLMRSIAEGEARAQASLRPGDRLVPVGELERREVEALCGQLVSYLDFEAELLPTFHPAYLEYKIDADHAVDYAGYPLVGQVDRIDVDGRGNAVIIDYKGSVNSEHEVAGKRRGHAGKVQTRIYAQVVKRSLGLNVVAALYVSYGRRPAVSGSYDPRVIEAAHLPGARADACSCGLLQEVPNPIPDDFSLADLAFDRMLDETEALVAHAVDGMASGVIAPAPAYASACRYCPVLACPKRGA